MAAVDREPVAAADLMPAAWAVGAPGLAFVVEAPAGALRVALRAVVVPTVDLRAEAGVAAEVRLPTADLPAVDGLRVLLGALAFLAAVLRTVLPDDAVEPVGADRVVGALREAAVAFVVVLSAAVFFVA